MGCLKMEPKGNLSEMIINWQISIRYEDNQIMTESWMHALGSSEEGDPVPKRDKRCKVDIRKRRNALLGGSRVNQLIRNHRYSDADGNSQEHRHAISGYALILDSVVRSVRDLFRVCLGCSSSCVWSVKRLGYLCE